MSLLLIPREVWQNILFHWIGSRDLLRLDCGLSHMPTTKPLLPIYAEQDLALDDDWKLHAKDLMGLSSWAQARGIRFCQMSLLEAKSMNRERCEGLFNLCSESLKKLVINQADESNAASSIITSVASHCVKLEVLHVYNSKPGPGVIGTILRNNASTLRNLLLETVTLELGELYKDLSTLPNLQVLRFANMSWTAKPEMYLDIEHFIFLCPNLIALSLHMCRTSHALLPLLPAWCPKLTRLQVMQTDDVNDYGLHCILHTNPNLVYLDIIDCPNITFAGFHNLCDKLTHLRTLIADNVPDTMLDIIVTQRLPSLRICYVGAVLSYDQLRAITAAHPKLTGFGMLCVQISPDVVDPTLILEHCRDVRHLAFFAQNTPTIDAMLSSAAIHCPQLNTLDVHDCATRSLAAVLLKSLRRCRNMRRIHVPEALHAKFPLSKFPQITVTSSGYINLDEWMPAGPL